MIAQNRTSTSRYDVPSDSVEATLKKQTPWENLDQRGNLNLSMDQSQHRRYHSHFEDMMN
ncbi:MAG: hypothetical protein HKN30_09285 [Sulfitobacter sp.]|nr:hypothetical protein [Sulfitobacter sp.]